MQPTAHTLTFGPSYRSVEVGDIAVLAQDAPLVLESGAQLSHVPLAYKTHGTLNAEKSNAILVCHGLTGDQYILDTHPVTSKPGWWSDYMVGPGKPLDTDKYFIICSNVLGGCLGSLGPKSINPATKEPYNLQFPVLTIGDMVKAQKLLIDKLGITQLMCVIGCSMGGMVALDWAARYPQHLKSAMFIATAARHSAQNIAFHEIGRQAIMADPDWQGGNYINAGTFPSKGLAVARMTAHVTYLSQAGLQHKFGRNLQDRAQVSYGFEADFQVESYLRYQGRNFVERFDPNSYLYITRAMDYFDLAADFGGSLGAAFTGAQHASFCVVSLSSDWLFTTAESKQIVRALAANAADVSFVEIPTDKGHDAFLLDVPLFYDAARGFIEKVAQQTGVK